MAEPPPAEIDWTFVVQIVDEKGTPGSIAFYVSPTRAITAGLRTGPDTDLLLQSEMGRQSPTRVIGTANLGGEARVSVLAAEERTSFPLLPWRTAPVAPGARWESMALMGEAGFPAGGTVTGGSNPLRLAPEGAFGHLSLLGAPVVVEGAVAGVIVRERGDSYDAAPTNVLLRALSRWLPPEPRQFSDEASRALGAAEALKGMAVVPDAEAVLYGLMAAGPSENFGNTLYVHLGGSAVDPASQILRRAGVGLAPAPAPLPPLTDAHFGGLVGVAHGLMERTEAGDGWIGARHLVGALLVSSAPTLVEAGARLPALRDEFLKTIADFCPEDDLAAWREELTAVGVGVAPRSWVQVRAGFRPDDLAGDDQLGITPDVNMLCDVLAARDVEPPMSVGLFGDWGTGKSFFMRQMENRINALMKVARAEEAAGRTSAYCANVVQIRFNAWSYLDANLWANIALGIFEKLATPPSEPGADVDPDAGEQKRIADERTLLLAELDTYKELHADVARDKDAAVAQRKEAADELERIAGEREKQAKGLADVRARDVIAELADDDVLRKARVKAAADLGLDEVNVTELRALAADLSSVGGRARAVWRLLQQRKAVAVTAVAVAASVVAGLILMLGPGRVRLAGVVSFLVSVSGGVAAFGKWVRPVLAKTGEALDSIEKGVRRAETRERELREEQAKEESVLAERVKALAAREAALAQQEAQTAAKVAETEQKLGDLVQGRRLYRFLEERSTTTEYRQHLGIVALIRRDFERLTRLLKSDRPVDAAAKLPSIDRIVLYVDDLDRCPPDRVVEVLQAVHLLLAFPIFVVVVGVDARWLLRSLKIHYAEMLGRRREDEPQDDDPELASWESSPQNYLEKIFQIPFALAPMDASGYSQLVRSLITVAAPVPETPVKSAPVPETPVEAAEPRPEAVEVEQQAEPAQAVEAVQEAPTVAASPSPPVIDPNPPSLDITPAELEFICELSDAMVSPRLTKRLVNIYRLVRAAQNEEELARYVDQHEYQRVLVLLTVLISFSPLAGVVYQRLVDASETDSWAEFVAAMEPLAEETDDEADAWRQLHGWLTDLAPSLRVGDAIAPYRHWASRLKRFSFETGRVR